MPDLWINYMFYGWKLGHQQGWETINLFIRCNTIQRNKRLDSLRARARAQHWLDNLLYETARLLRIKTESVATQCLITSFS